MKYDIIIIGSGLGGLTAGAKLAKHGNKVLLIEQHDRVGGCATTFKRKDYTLEVGLHEMDGLHKKDMKMKIFRDLGVFDEVKFLKVPEFYNFKNAQHQIVIPHNSEEATKLLAEKFPNEKTGIEKYFEQILNARKNLKKNAGKKEISVGEFLDSIIQNDDLKLILLGNLGYFHDDPYTMSLNYYSVAQGSYFEGGGNYIKGGSQKLSDYLARFIEKNNGKVILNHLVTEIIVENDTAIGVIYKNKKNESIKVFADEIIANASLPQIANTLLPKKYGEQIKEQIKDKKIGASLLSVYFGFDKTPKELGSKYYSTFVYDDSVKTQKDILPNNKGDFENRSFTFIDYSQIDSDLAPKGKSVGVICCIDYLSDWENLNKNEYKAQKDKVAEIFTEKLEKLVPGIKKHIEYCEVGTSKTVERYTLNPEGAVYGFAQNPKETLPEKIQTIDNLHFASAWTIIGGGFSGAIYNGYLTAFSIIRSRR